MLFNIILDDDQREFLHRVLDDMRATTDEDEAVSALEAAIASIEEAKE